MGGFGMGDVIGGFRDRGGGVMGGVMDFQMMPDVETYDSNSAPPVCVCVCVCVCLCV